MTYLERQKLEKQTAFEVGMRIGRQQTIDFLQLALQSKHGFAEKRTWEILMEIKELYDQFRPAFDIKHPECDYFRELLDRALSQNCGKEHPLIPFAERYEDLKQVQYGGKKR
jgi:hypothetical protein